MFCIKRGLASGGGRYNCLLVIWVCDIAGCKYTRHAGCLCVSFNLYVSLFVKRYLGLEYIGIRLVSDCQEESVDVDVEFLLSVGTGVFNQMCSFDEFFSKQPECLGVE